MKRRQQGIYEGNLSTDHQGSPFVGKIVDVPPVERGWSQKINHLFSLRAKIPALVVTAALIWGFLGQIILPPEYRLSTFLGQRLGDLETAQVNTALPAETNKAEIIHATQGKVQIIQACITERNQRSQQAYAECISRGGILYSCIFQRDEMQKAPCNEFSAEQLVTDFQQKLNQGGHHEE